MALHSLLLGKVPMRRSTSVIEALQLDDQPAAYSHCLWFFDPSPIHHGFHPIDPPLQQASAPALHRLFCQQRLFREQHTRSQDPEILNQALCVDPPGRVWECQRSFLNCKS